MKKKGLILIGAGIFVLCLAFAGVPDWLAASAVAAFVGSSFIFS